MFYSDPMKTLKLLVFSAVLVAAYALDNHFAKSQPAANQPVSVVGDDDPIPRCPTWPECGGNAQ